MNVMATARSIGLLDERGREVFGNIEEEAVLRALADLAAAHPAHTDLIDEAELRVVSARSAGVETHDAHSVLARGRASNTVQLRYRTEMAAIFADLAIDIGLRGVPADA